MKLIFLLLLTSCLLSPKTEPCDSIFGYEYHPGTMVAQKFNGTLKLTNSYTRQEGHKKRRQNISRWDSTFQFKDLPDYYDCQGLSEATLRKYLKTEIGSTLEVSGIYLFHPMNGRKLGLQIRMVNKEPAHLAFEVSCKFPLPNNNFTEMPVVAE